VGLRKLSTVDYPNKLCIDLTVAGCNYRCPFCPHEDLIYHYIPMEKTGLEELVRTLRPRLGFLDGVSLSGGEPLLHRELIDFLRELKYQGSLIKIKTNGSRPKAIQILIDRRLVDFFSVFIPAPLSKYNQVTNYNIDIEEISKAIQIIRKNGIKHEFRVKPIPGLIEKPELMEIANMLIGAPRFVIERFEPEKSLDKDYRELVPFSDDELYELRDSVAPYFHEALVEP